MRKVRYFIPAWWGGLAVLCLQGTSGFSQHLASTRPIITLVDSPVQGSVQSLRQVMEELKSKRGIFFIFNSKNMKDKLVDGRYNASEETEVVLNKLLKPVGLTFQKVGNVYVIVDEKAPQVNKEAKKQARSGGHSDTTAHAIDAVLAPSLEAATASAVAVSTITGRVTNENNEGIPGVTVLVKGTTTGTTTNPEGSYTLSVPDAQASGVLVFSYIGYVTEEMPINNSSTINVTLIPDIKALSEVVVVGYGTQKRADLTGSVASVKGENIKNLPANSVSETLQGRMAGVEVVKGSGAPGSGSSIIIRGVSSLRNKAPLYIVDGVRQSGDNINMQDIESVDVLKDASAASIYGAAAAGGVIIVTTKKGLKNSKPQVNFSARYGVVQPRLYQLLNRDEFVRLKRYLNPTYLQDVDINELPDTDWMDAMYKNGAEQNYNLSVSGATENTNYYVSGFYDREDGVMIDNSVATYGARVNTEIKLGPRIRIGEQLYAYERAANPLSTYTNESSSGNDNGAQNPFFRTQPIMAIYDETNPVGGWGRSPAGFDGTNYVGTEYSADIERKSFQLQGNAFVEISLPLHLTFRTTLGYTVDEDRNNIFRDRFDFGQVKNAVNSLEKQSASTRRILHNSVLTYAQSFGKHNVKALAGYEQIITRSSSVNGTQTAVALEPTYSFFPTSASTSIISGNVDDNGFLKSYFGRINYDFAGKYLFTASVRRDANFQKFGPGNQYGLFPSASVGWRVSDEAFFQSFLPVVSTFKLRASYGLLGNDNIDSYLFLSTYDMVSAQNFSPGGSRNLGFSQKSIPNQNIRWETVYEGNVGIDAELLQGKVYLTADWYDKTTRDMLYNLPIPNSAGFSGTNVTTRFTTNIGSVRNRGLEVLLGYRDKVRSFTYDVSFNGAFNKNKVLNLDDINQNPINAGDNGFGYGVMSRQNISRTQAGLPFGQFFGYRALGIYQTDDEAAAGPQFPGKMARAGDLIFEDADGDGKLTSDDRVFMGNPNPFFVYGFNLSLNWKGFDLQALFNGVAGVDIFNGVSPYNSYLFGDGNTTRDVFGASFLGDNGLTDQPRLGYLDTDANGNVKFQNDPNGNYTLVNSYFVESGSYLKLKNLQLGYNLPAKWLAFLHLRESRIFLMGNNLLAFTKYSGADPEIGGGVTDRGIDRPIRYPQVRTYSLGLNLGF